MNEHSPSKLQNASLENSTITDHLLEKQTSSRGVSSGIEWARQFSLGFIILQKCPQQVFMELRML